MYHKLYLKLLFNSLGLLVCQEVNSIAYYCKHEDPNVPPRSHQDCTRFCFLPRNL